MFRVDRARRDRDRRALLAGRGVLVHRLGTNALAAVGVLARQMSPGATAAATVTAANARAMTSGVAPMPRWRRSSSDAGHDA
jgi:hypothetical protein